MKISFIFVLFVTILTFALGRPTEEECKKVETICNKGCEKITKNKQERCLKKCKQDYYNCSGWGR